MGDVVVGSLSETHVVRDLMLIFNYKRKNGKVEVEHEPELIVSLLSTVVNEREHVILDLRDVVSVLLGSEKFSSSCYEFSVVQKLYDYYVIKVDDSSVVVLVLHSSGESFTFRLTREHIMELIEKLSDEGRKALSEYLSRECGVKI